jgi:hypothetical protein
MEKAHTPPKTSLFKSVIDGKASKADKEELLTLYLDLGKNKPPKGSESDWKKRTDAVVAAAKDVVADKPDAVKKLQAAVKCMNCHEAHKAD